MTQRNVVDLPIPITGNRLTIQDKMQVEYWAAGPAGTHYDIEISLDPFEDEEIGDFISVCLKGQMWATWNAARRSEQILLWQSVSGVDLGMYRSIFDALTFIHPFAS